MAPRLISLGCLIAEPAERLEVTEHTFTERRARCPCAVRWLAAHRPLRSSNARRNSTAEHFAVTHRRRVPNGSVRKNPSGPAYMTSWERLTLSRPKGLKHRVLLTGRSPINGAVALGSRIAETAQGATGNAVMGSGTLGQFHGYFLMDSASTATAATPKPTKSMVLSFFSSMVSEPPPVPPPPPPPPPPV